MALRRQGSQVRILSGAPVNKKGSPPRGPFFVYLVCSAQGGGPCSTKSRSDFGRRRRPAGVSRHSRRINPVGRASKQKRVPSKGALFCLPGVFRPRRRTLFDKIAPAIWTERRSRESSEHGEAVRQACRAATAHPVGRASKRKLGPLRGLFCLPGVSHPDRTLFDNAAQPQIRQLSAPISPAKVAASGARRDTVACPSSVIGA